MNSTNIKRPRRKLKTKWCHLGELTPLDVDVLGLGYDINSVIELNLVKGGKGLFSLDPKGINSDGGRILKRIRPLY
jgi:hypothetical protein